MEELPQKNFEGWAIIEQMGHNRYAGYVTTEAYGQAVLFRIDIPTLEERERTTERPSYDPHGNYLPAGTKVKDGAVQGYTKYIGPGTLYALTPCSRETVLAAVEQMQPRPVMVVGMPTQPKALDPAADLVLTHEDRESEDAEELENAG